MCARAAHARTHALATRHPGDGERRSGIALILHISQKVRVRTFPQIVQSDSIFIKMRLTYSVTCSLSMSASILLTNMVAQLHKIDHWHEWRTQMGGAPV